MRIEHEKCGKTARRYYSRYDMFACAECDEWTEEICDCDPTRVDPAFEGPCPMKLAFLEDGSPDRPSMSPSRWRTFDD